ncbi:MAG: bifunctional folylpolyglutamate synthase/dihydrofolate synthase, partial [Deltaproteobacteria bacterium]|nr:bifunctional folylpolyglutamate synthase/dihydrofolate synthase [Deltaproteobacteria bacterium]
PWRVADSAHTAASARALAEALARLPARRARLVLSVSAGKDLAAILDALLPGFESVTVTRAEPTRSLKPADVAAAVRAASPGAAVRAVPNPHMALRAALEGLGEDDLVCAAGSVYLAGLARQVLA